jgi:hypothetical protein
MIERTSRLLVVRGDRHDRPVVGRLIVGASCADRCDHPDKQDRKNEPR